MRTVLSLAVVFGIAAAAAAAEPPTITGTMPNLVLAQAVSKDGEVTLTVKYPVTVWKEVTETKSVEQVRRVDGKEVKFSHSANMAK